MRGVKPAAPTKPGEGKVGEEAAIAGAVFFFEAEAGGKAGVGGMTLSDVGFEVGEDVEGGV